MKQDESLSKVEEMQEPKTVQEGQADDAGDMSLVAHLEELRSRIIRSLLAIVVGSGAAYFLLDDIMHYITLPAGKLYYMQPAEAFFTYMKGDIFAGFLLAVPIVFYQIWRFFLPAFTAKERMLVSIVVPVSVLLFFMGLVFSFVFVLPVGVKFFIGFGTSELQPLFSIDKYLDFVIAFVLPFGIIAELPLIIVILARMGFVTSAFLKKQQRVVILLSVIVGAVISPTPDVFSQLMIAIPVIMLYEISYVIVRFILRK